MKPLCGKAPIYNWNVGPLCYALDSTKRSTHVLQLLMVRKCHGRKDYQLENVEKDGNRQINSATIQDEKITISRTFYKT